MRDDPLGAWLREGETPAAGSSRRAEGGYPGGLPGFADLDDLPDMADMADLDDDGARRGGSRLGRSRLGGRRLWALAATVWTVVVVLAVGVVARGAEPTTAPSPSGAPPAPTPAPAAVTPSTAGVAEGAARAAAVLAVRAAVTDADPSARARYVDLAVAETVERVGDLAVVTVVAVVLHGDGATWAEARVVRFGVPMRVGVTEAVVMGAPYALPPPSVAFEGDAGPPPSAGWEPVPDADVARFAGALAAAGYRDAMGLRAARSADLPGVVRVEATAVAPGEEVDGAHVVWLRDADPPVVLGTPGQEPEAVSAGASGGTPTTASDPEPEPLPTSAPSTAPTAPPAEPTPTAPEP